MRNKYRSAVYYVGRQVDKGEIQSIIQSFQTDFEESIITKVLTLNEFRLNDEGLLNYFEKNSDNQFCQRYIHPKLEHIRKEFGRHVK